MVRNTQVEAVTLDEAGAGVGHVAEGAAVLEVHVADLLPGERAEVEIEHRSPHRALAWGRITARVGAPSPDRVAPACPGFGACGGCAWQHLAYPAQRLEKRRRLARALAEVPSLLGGMVAIAPVVPSPAELGYRNKGKYVAAAVDGRLVLGAYAPRSHRVIDTAACRVVAPVIAEIAAHTRQACEAAGVAAYVEARKSGELRYVIVRADDAGGALVVLVVTSAARPAPLAAAAAAIAAHPAVRGVVAMKNDRDDAAIVTDDVTVLAGAATLTETVAGCPVEVGAGEFLQVNRDQARAIYARVADLALDGQPAARAIDLYAGLGGITLTLARRGATVDAVELDAGATAALGRAAAAGGLADRVRVHTGDAATAAVLSVAPDVVVVNPPRKGLSAETRAALLQLAPPRIVYVSCGPDSLGRDLAALAAWYKPDVIAPHDLMPGTSQVETVVRLVRQES
jgi:23S rRNA (uracil1939-C5)-methyltransferase